MMITGQLPVHDVIAEQYVLVGCILQDGAADAALSVLTHEDFFRDDYRSIFETIEYLHSHGEKIELARVCSRMVETGTIKTGHDKAALVDLVNETPFVSLDNIETHTRRVRNKSIQRRLVATCQRIVASGYDNTIDVFDYIADVEAALSAVCEIPSEPEFAWMREGVIGFYKNMQIAGTKESKTVATGMKQLDDLVKLTPGTHTVIGARPGMGKTALGTTIALNAAEAGKAVLFFSIEMGLDQMMERIIGSTGRIDISRIRRNGGATSDEWRLLTETAQRTQNYNLMIDYAADVTPGLIRARARRSQSRMAKRGLELGLIVVDYLQLIRSPSQNKYQSREQEVSFVSRELKRLAKEMQVPIISLAQLNRAVEKQSDKRPRLADLRESGAIEQDADAVVFIHREDYYDRDLPYSRDGSESEIIVSKNRMGPTGTARALFHQQWGLFEDHK